MKTLTKIGFSEGTWKIAAYDIESVNKVDFYMLGFYDGNEYISFDSVDDFLNYVIRKKYRGYRIFAHNGGRFDFLFIMERIANNFPDLRFETITSGSSVIALKLFDRNNNCWKFNDSFKLLPKGLRELCLTFDTEHKKQDIDYEQMANLPPHEVAEYMRNDTLGLYEVLQSFRKWLSNNHTPMRFTIASQAMAYYRTMMPVNLDNLPKKIEAFIRRAYVGGRVEIYKMYSDRKVHMFDVNSLYPYVMKKYPMPVGIPIYTRSFKDGQPGFYKATVTVPDMYIPVLPHNGNKLLFPTGTFTGYFTGIELQYLIELGGNVEVDYGYWFHAEHIFDEFVDTLYRKKAEAKSPAEREIAKLMMNGLYGKFGERREKEQLVQLPIEKGYGYKMYSPHHKLYLKPCYSRSRSIIPSISAWITGAARFELIKLMHSLPEHKIFYTDTDCVVTSGILPTGKGIGELKEEMVGSRAIFLRPKLYIIDGDDMRKKAKGFNRNFIRMLDFEAFEAALTGDFSRFRQQIREMGTLKQSLLQNSCFVSMVELRRSVKSPYDKRTVMDDYDTRPLNCPIPNALHV